MSEITRNSTSGIESEQRGNCSFVIKTTLDGHNGGREYYLRAGSAEECKKIVQTLKRFSQSAKFRAEAHSRFSKTQFLVRQFYVSSPFHYTSALLIAAVITLLAGACMLASYSQKLKPYWRNHNQNLPPSSELRHEQSQTATLRRRAETRQPRQTPPQQP